MVTITAALRTSVSLPNPKYASYQSAMGSQTIDIHSSAQSDAQELLDLKFKLKNTQPAKIAMPRESSTDSNDCKRPASGRHKQLSSLIRKSVSVI
jgi:hypothetical protein